MDSSEALTVWLLYRNATLYKLFTSKSGAMAFAGHEPKDWSEIGGAYRVGGGRSYEYYIVEKEVASG